MEEKTILELQDVKVTNSRFVVGSQTFAVSNITSVKASQENPSRFGPIVLVVIGVLALAGSVAFGIASIVIGVIWGLLQKTKFHIVLTTAGGETKALSSEQREYIEKVVEALNEAIVVRG